MLPGRHSHRTTALLRKLSTRTSGRGISKVCPFPASVIWYVKSLVRVIVVPSVP